MGDISNGKCVAVLDGQIYANALSVIQVKNFYGLSGL